MCAMSVVALNCPVCGAAVSTKQKLCEYCDNELVITSFTSVLSMGSKQSRKYIESYRQALATDPDNAHINSAVAMCYLNLGLHDKAYEAFSRAIEDDFDNPETYFYCAVSRLEGKRPYSLTLSEVRKVEQYLDAAISIEPRGVFYLFHAFVKHDFFERKCLNTTPDYRELFATAREIGVSDTDVAVLEELLGYQVWV